MNESIELKMSEWVDQGDNVSMFKFASLLFITAPKDKEPQMQEILYQAQQILVFHYGPIEGREVGRFLIVNNFLKF